MGPGFHRLYAGRLAWRYRLGLALGLALLGLLHPLWALASPLALLLPTGLWEGQALRAIARQSLAYPTALAYGEERLWQEARRVRVEPPPFPLGLLLAYLLVLLLALALAAWKAPDGGAWPLLGGPSREAPSGPQEASQGRETPTSGQAPKESKETQAGEQSASQTPSLSEEARGVQETGGPRRPEGGPSPLGKEARAASEKPTSPGEARPPQTGEGQASAPGLEEASQGLPLAPLPSPLGPEGGLLSPAGQGRASPLPAPWPQDRPPEEVRRGVEVYLERTPLPPEERELLRRYFALP